MRNRFPGEESAGILLADSPKTSHLLPHNHPQLPVSLRLTAPVRSFPPRSILPANLTEIQPFRSRTFPMFQPVGFYVETESALVSRGDY